MIVPFMCKFWRKCNKFSTIFWSLIFHISLPRLGYFLLQKRKPKIFRLESVMKKNPHFRQLDISASGQLDNPTCRHLELHISTTRRLEISMTWNSWLEKWTSRQLPWTLGGSVERRNVTSQKLKFVKLGVGCGIFRKNKIKKSPLAKN